MAGRKWSALSTVPGSDCYVELSVHAGLEVAHDIEEACAHQGWSSGTVTAMCVLAWPAAVIPAELSGESPRGAWSWRAVLNAAEWRRERFWQLEYLIDITPSE